MPSPDQSSEIIILQRDLDATSASFDDAIEKDTPLIELKRIFHEMKLLQMQIKVLKGDKPEVRENDKTSH